MLTASASSSAPVERLWGLCSDPTRWPDHLDTFRSVTRVGGGPGVGVGARFLVVQPGLAGATYEVTSWVPGSSFTWVARAPGVLTTATHRVTADGEGSRVELGLEWSGPLARLVRALLSRRARRMIGTEATTLARVAGTSP